MAIEVFQVEWTKLLLFDQARMQSSAQEGGIYIEARETSRGKELYYIGKAKEFYGRSRTHQNYASHELNKTEQKKRFITFGLITSFEKSRLSHEITPEQLKEIESFFINYYRPAGNNAITKKGYKGHPIIVFNTGKRGFMSKTVTSCPDLVKFLKTNLTTQTRATTSFSLF
jgi:hypothetical protein